MDPQEITKAIKAGLVIAGLAGANISPEHQKIIIEGGLVLYALFLAVESVLKRRVRRRAVKRGVAK